MKSDIPGSKTILFSLVFILSSLLCFSQQPELVVQTGHNKPVRTMVFSHNGALLATAGLDFRVILWDVKTGMKLRELPVKAQVSQIVFSADDRYLISCSDSYSYSLLNEYSVIKWDIIKGTEVTRNKSFKHALTSVACSSDDKYIAATEDWYNFYIMDANDLKLLYTLNIQDGLNSVIFSADSKNIVVTGKDKLYILDTPPHSNKRVITDWGNSNGRILKTFFTGHDLTALGWIGEHQIIKSWDIQSLKEKEPAKVIDESQVVISGDLKYLAGCSNGIKVHSYPSLKLYSEYSYPPAQKLYYYEESISISPDCNTLAYSCNEDIVLWDIGSKRVLKILKPVTTTSDAVAVSPDGRTMTGYNEGAGLTVWDPLQVRLKFNIEWGGEKIYDKTVEDAFFLSSTGRVFTQSSRFSFLWDLMNKDSRLIRDGIGKQICFSNNYEQFAFFGGNSMYPEVNFSKVSGNKKDEETVLKKNLKTGVLLPDKKLFIASGEDKLNFYSFPSLNFLKSFENRAPAVIVANNISTVASIDNNGSKVLLYDYLSIEKSGEISNPSASEIMYISFSPDGKQLLYQYFDNHMVSHLGIWDILKKRDALNPFDTVTNMMGKLTFSPDKKRIAIFRALYKRSNVYENNTGLQIYDYSTGNLLFSADDLNSFAFCPEGDKIFVVDYTGSIKLINYITGKEIATWVKVGENDYIVVTPDRYFTASKGALGSIAFRVGNSAFPFEQFDLQYNRPDQVLKNIGLAPQSLINSYYRAYQRRLRKMKIDENSFNEDMHLPEIAVVNQNIPVSTGKKSLTIRIKATDSKYLLDRLNISINDVPVFGIRGIDLSGNKTSAWEQEINLLLSNGNNKIQISVLNSKGVESLRETYNITCTGPSHLPTLYVLAIGASRYKDSIYNLDYADKDASDLVAEFASLKGVTFEEVKTMILNNEKATRTEILAAKKFLLQSSVDDMVLLFYAGHGIVDSQLDYYLGTYDIDFNNPSVNGLAYEEIDNLLDGLRTRQKLLLIDACFSGEIEKSEIKYLAAASDTAKGNIKFRSFTDKRGMRIKQDLLDNAVQLQQEMFADLRRGTGAVVISSSTGDEYSFEGSDWKNGVFTYTILEGIRQKKADQNNDGQINISELQKYVIKRVGDLTNGGQTPTIRQENLAEDFCIIKRIN
jgi:WD40 repeat protein